MFHHSSANLTPEKYRNTIITHNIEVKVIFSKAENKPKNRYKEVQHTIRRYASAQSRKEKDKEMRSKLFNLSTSQCYHPFIIHTRLKDMYNDTHQGNQIKCKERVFNHPSKRFDYSKTEITKEKYIYINHLLRRDISVNAFEWSDNHFITYSTK